MTDLTNELPSMDWEPWTGPESGQGTLPDRQIWDATLASLGLAYRLAFLSKGDLTTTLSKMDEEDGLALVAEIGSARELLVCMTELLSMIEARVMVAAVAIDAEAK